MRLLKKNPLLRIGNDLLIDSPQPINLNYSWNFGSLLAISLIIQIISGITLAMHYNPNITEAFNSLEHIMRDVNFGWLIRYLHSNTASIFFLLVYLHIGRGMYYGSYKLSRTLVWTIGTIIFILMMATAFLGYVLPYGQMSLWGATVITNLMSAIPWVGQDIVEFIWGGFSVNNATLNRFFSLHFILPFILAGLALLHLIVLHDTTSSNNPIGLSANYERISFEPYYIFKDLITIYLYILVLSIFISYMPNLLGDSENYVMANPMQTPAAIVPEWYLLPFYAILRSIPNKLLGVIAMFLAILILLILPVVDSSKSRGIQFKPLQKIFFFMFVSNILVLMQLGAKHVESPFIELGQISTVFYFLYFFLITPCLALLENSLISINLKEKENISNFNRSGFYFFKFFKKIKSAFSKKTKKFFTFVFKAITLTIISFIIKFLFQKYFNINFFVLNVDGNFLHNFISDFFYNLTGLSILGFSYIGIDYIVDILSEHISTIYKSNTTGISKCLTINSESAESTNSFDIKDHAEQSLFMCRSSNDNFTGNISANLQGENSNPQGDYLDINNQAQGFYFDQVRNKYTIYDPTGVRQRGYINPATGQPYPSSQPYLKNLASALNHSRNSANYRGDHLISPERETSFFSNEDIQIFHQFMRHEYPLRQSSGLCNTSTVRDIMFRKP